MATYCHIDFKPMGKASLLVAEKGDEQNFV
jgi:hypothetical protein